MAHRLAWLIYRMLKYGQNYVDKGMQYHEDQCRRQQIERLKKTAAKFGFQIIDARRKASFWRAFSSCVENLARRAGAER
jgi:hypothetical protein